MPRPGRMVRPGGQAERAAGPRAGPARRAGAGHRARSCPGRPAPRRRSWPGRARPRAAVRYIRQVATSVASKRSVLKPAARKARGSLMPSWRVARIAAWPPHRSIGVAPRDEELAAAGRERRAGGSAASGGSAGSRAGRSGSAGSPAARAGRPSPGGGCRWPGRRPRLDRNAAIRARASGASRTSASRKTSSGWRACRARTQQACCLPHQPAGSSGARASRTRSSAAASSCDDRGRPVVGVVVEDDDLELDARLASAAATAAPIGASSLRAGIRTETGARQPGRRAGRRVEAEVARKSRAEIGRGPGAGQVRAWHDRRGSRRDQIPELISHRQFQVDAMSPVRVDRRCSGSRTDARRESGPPSRRQRS